MKKLFIAPIKLAIPIALLPVIMATSRHFVFVLVTVPVMLSGTQKLARTSLLLSLLNTSEQSLLAHPHMFRTQNAHRLRPTASAIVPLTVLRVSLLTVRLMNPLDM